MTRGVISSYRDFLLANTISISLGEHPFCTMPFQYQKVLVIGATSGVSSSRWHPLSGASTKAPNQVSEKH
jgi:hypothetical protein